MRTIYRLAFLTAQSRMWADVFEVEEIDLFGRIGRLYTRRGVVETPTLTPVINPAKPVLEPSRISSLGFPMLMTNSYIILRNYGELAKEVGVHGILGVQNPVFTDSGAYQLMVYGKVEVSPREIVEYQLDIGSDIGVVLDIPTRKDTPYEQAAREVDETIKRVREALELDLRGMLLVAPVQGGTHTPLVAYAASELAKLPASLYAVGGPTQLMEGYDYKELVRLVMTARLNLPWGAPLHLFGAGHPMMLALAVAMGVDTFDSASYALYARDDRLMTPSGTLRLSELSELPCSCPVCSKYSALELRKTPRQERVALIAEHNLHVLSGELRRIREAIREGRLWELVERRASAHPALMDALREFVKYVRFIERKHPATRQPVRGIFFLSSLSRYRPEVVRHQERLFSRFARKQDLLLLFEETPQKPFTRFGLIKEILADEPGLTDLCDPAVLSLAFSVIPLELDGVYPLSQYEASRRILDSSAEEIVSDVVWYVLNKGYRGVVLVHYSLPERVVRRMGELFKSEEIVFVPILLENYQEALREHREVAARVRAIVESLSAFTRDRRGAPAHA
ncbi:MAG: tRNA guanosine(15) transglycosylase TgtA [Thermofilum sp.]